MYLLNLAKTSCKLGVREADGSTESDGGNCEEAGPRCRCCGFRDSLNAPVGWRVEGSGEWREEQGVGRRE